MLDEGVYSVVCIFFLKDGCGCHQSNEFWLVKHISDHVAVCVDIRRGMAFECVHVVIRLKEEQILTTVLVEVSFIFDLIQRVFTQLDKCRFIVWQHHN